jgi:uncharacterized repeat protein (TIGR03803 family)
MKRGHVTEQLREGAKVEQPCGNRFHPQKAGRRLPSRFNIGFLALFIIVIQAAQAQEFSTVYSFTGGADGGHPFRGLVLDEQGNFYGVTVAGGSSAHGHIGRGFGVIFELTPGASETVLYNFLGKKTGDGAYPEVALFRDANGNLFGTTVKGGNSNKGTVFELTTGGKESVLHSFGEKPDGRFPSNVIQDASGNLIGATGVGGAYGKGMVFAVGSDGTETLLHTFTKMEGGDAGGGLTMDAQGNLYGTTMGGGPNKYGTVFMLAPNGTLTVLYSFLAKPDGHSPIGSMVRDAQGNLYGATLDGGAYGFGTVFQVTPSGVETVLHSFSGSGDGYFPFDGLVRDAQGNLYGTTSGSGCTGDSCYGSVFKVTPSGVETILHTFNGVDGFNPFGLVLDSAGNLFGTTYGGGTFGYGTVFKVTP